MKTLITVMFFAALLAAVGCKTDPGKGGDASSGATANTNAKPAADWSCCEKAKAVDGWCDQCGQGFHKGKSTACKECHAAMKSGADSCPAHAEKKG